MKEYIKQLIMKLFPRTYGKYILYSVYHLDKIERARAERILRIRSKNQVNVLFIASSLSMWRLDDVYELLANDSRFIVHVVICPFRTFEPDQRNRSINDLRDYALKQGWVFSIKDNLNNRDNSIFLSFDPDIIFYPQLFGRLFENELDCEKNLDRLIAYTPYGLPTVSGDWMYNSRYMNTVWKLFFPTKLHLRHAWKHYFNRAKNMEIVGDPHASDFLNRSHSYHWKEQETKKKKVVWAPHFSIGEDGHLHRASFLWLNNIMWEISQEYREQIQFVFKPHPRLLSELYRHPNWGKEKADAYYDRWRNGDNTQLETGAYVDLFCTSDAMIHDCGSFTAEYHYTGKPVAFVSQDYKSVYQGLDRFGKMCLNLHYQTRSVEEIRSFLDNVVLEEIDGLKNKRESFRKKYLIPAEGTSFAMSVYKSLSRSIFGE